MVVVGRKDAWNQTVGSQTALTGVSISPHQATSSFPGTPTDEVPRSLAYAVIRIQNQPFPSRSISRPEKGTSSAYPDKPAEEQREPFELDVIALLR